MIMDLTREQLLEILSRATQFLFEELDLVIAARHNNRDEGAEVRWVVHKAGNPLRLLNKQGRWETQTLRAYNSDAFIARTRMTLGEAFSLATGILKAQAEACPFCGGKLVGQEAITPLTDDNVTSWMLLWKDIADDVEKGAKFCEKCRRIHWPNTPAAVAAS